MRRSAGVVVAALAVQLVGPSSVLAAKPAGSSAAPASSAAPDPAPDAAALKKRGDDAMDALRFADALAAYEQVYAITKNPALLYNQARAWQSLGDFPQALAFYECFAAEAPADLKARVPRLAQIMDDVRAQIAKLTVRCNVDGAQVVLGGRVLGTTPLPAEMRKVAGKATLEVTAEGYEPFRREIDLPRGGSLAIEVELVRKDSSATLAVRSNVPSSMVSVDGKVQGQTPIELVVRAGAHTLQLQQDGYQPLQTQVVLNVGERKEVDLELSRPPPIYAKWWFWTAVGVVAVGATVTVIALTTERSPDSGSMTPGRLSAPLVARW